MSEGWCSQRGVGVIGSERGGVVRGASGHRLEGTPGPAQRVDGGGALVAAAWADATGVMREMKG
jgi:hypothetical protein